MHCKEKTEKFREICCLLTLESFEQHGLDDS